MKALKSLKQEQGCIGNEILLHFPRRLILNVSRAMGLPIFQIFQSSKFVNPKVCQLLMYFPGLPYLFKVQKDFSNNFFGLQNGHFWKSCLVAAVPDMEPELSVTWAQDLPQYHVRLLFFTCSCAFNELYLTYNGRHRLSRFKPKLL